MNQLSGLQYHSVVKSTVVEKPWGYYEDFFRQPDCVFKIITVNPGDRLSLQKHAKRSEVWVCLSGRGRAEVYSESILKGLLLERCYIMLPGARIDIAVGEVHRLSNSSNESLVIAEMQYGDCNEDDIIRLEDDFGRA